MKSMFRKVALAALLFTLAAPAGSEELAKVRTFTQTNFPAFPNFVANELGLFKKYGIDPDLRYFPSGAPIVQAGAAKEWDIAFLGAPPVVIGTKPLDILTIGVVTDDAHELIGRPDYVTAALADHSKLKGAKIFVTTLSTGHYMVEGCLKKFGLGTNDVTIVPSDQTATVSAFSSGQGDLAQAWAPFNDALLARGNKVLCSAEEIGLSIPTVWVVTRSFAEAHPDLVVNWIRANGEAIDWIKADKTRTAEMFRKFLALGGTIANDDVVDSGVKASMESKSLSEQLPFLTAEGGSAPKLAAIYTGIGEFFVRNGRMDQVPDYLPYIDASYLQKAIAH